MSTVTALFVSSEDSVDCKPSKAEILRGIVADKLTAAAQEILAVVEGTVAGYEEEAAGLRQEIERQRRLLELLLQPQVALCRIDEQFPVCEPAAGGGGGGGVELPKEEEQHKYEPNVEDSEIQDILVHSEEEEGEGPTVHLGVCLMKDSHTEVLKNGVLKSPMKDLWCPRGLQESDFLDLLRSTFPQLTGQFDVFVTDATRKLMPLKVRTLTPEEIKRSIKSTVNRGSALYISTKKAKKSLTSTEQLLPPQKKEEANDENGSHENSVEKGESSDADRLSRNSRWQQQTEREADEEQRGISDDFSALSSVRPAAERKGNYYGDDDDDEVVDEDDLDDDWKPDKNDEELRESDAEQDPSKTMRKKWVELSGVKTKRRKWMQSTGNSDAPLSCKVCRTLHGSINMLIKHSWSHVDDPERLCGVCGQHSESAGDLRSHLESHKRIHNDMENSRSMDILSHAGEEDGEDEGEESAFTWDQPEKRKYSRQGLLSLRVCLLKDTHTDVLKKGVLKCPMQNLRCPRALQEPDFVDLLRSTFPQLTGQFEVFTTDGTKKLTPLNIRTLTPVEIKRSIKSALYISTKRAEKSLTSTEQHPPPPPPQKKDRPHASSVEKVERNKADRQPSNSRQRQQMETEEDGEQRGVSDNFSALSPVRSAAETNGNNGEMEEDDDWKQEKNDEALSKSKAEPNSSMTMRKRRVKRGFKAKQRKPMQSSPKASTNNNDASLSCKVCQTLCRSVNTLIKHSWSHVNNPERLCGVCAEHSESAEELKSHLESHQKLYSCNVCGKSFFHGSTLNNHVALHTRRRPYKCDVCNKSFGLKQQLFIHCRTHTGEKPYRCDVCNNSFPNVSSLSQHKLCHVGEKRHVNIHTDRDKLYLCNICCKTFPTPGQLRAYLRTHEEKIMCSECGKGLSSQTSLNRHMLIHTGERPYKCSKCGRAFNTKSILNNHLRTHSGRKPFVCEVCGKSCARRGSLKVHMRTHNGEKPYQCTVCNRAFNHGHSLKKHMKRHHTEEKSAADGMKS